MKRIIASLTVLLACWPTLAPGQSAPEPSTPGEVEEQSSDGDEETTDSEADSKSTDTTSNPYTSDALAPLSPDDGYGDQGIAPQNRFDQTLSERAVVDRRFESSSMADRNIAVPTAETPGQGDIVFATYNILMNQLSYGVSDDLSLTLGGNIPTADADFIGTFSAKYQVLDNRNYTVSVQPFTAYANGVREMDTLQWGLGGGLLFDWKVLDMMVVHFGGYGFLNVVYGADRYDFSGCQDVTRSEFLESDCRNIVTDVSAFPAGGHWIAGSTGVTLYPFNHVAVHAELIVGGVWGTFFGTERNGDAQDAEDPTPPDTEPFENPTFRLGFPHNAGPTWSLGASWSDGKFGMQLSFLFFGNNDDPATQTIDESQETRLLPVFAASYAF